MMKTQDDVEDLRELAQLVIEARGERGVIQRTGRVVDGVPVGWSFDCCGVIAAIEIRPGDEVLYAGWTVDELREISDASTRQSPGLSQ